MRIAVLLSVGTLFLLVACDPQTPPETEAGETTQAGAGFDFELLEWQCGHASASTQEVVISADGEFCLAELDVMNRGASAATLEIPCQFMFDGENRYEPHPEVMALDELAVAGFGQEIAPGELVQNSALYYDVPKGSHPDALELHETCEGDGLRLPLTPELKGAET